MDRSRPLRPEPVDRTPYGAFASMAGVVVGIYLLAGWLLGLAIGQVRHTHVSFPHFSAPHVSAPTNVGGQVQDALHDAADSAAKSAVDSATQAAKDEAARQAQSVQHDIQSNLENSLK